MICSEFYSEIKVHPETLFCDASAKVGLCKRRGGWGFVGRHQGLGALPSAGVMPLPVSPAVPGLGAVTFWPSCSPQAGGCDPLALLLSPGWGLWPSGPPALPGVGAVTLCLSPLGWGL